MRSDELESKYFVTANNFARELLLDSLECENKAFLLPSLTRTSFKLDKGFDLIDKILEEKHRS